MKKLRELQKGRWCGVVAGRAVTLAEMANGWLVYIDHILQNKSAFRTALSAYRWVCGVIEVGIETVSAPSRRGLVRARIQPAPSRRLRYRH